ncbi:unnamed protein product [Euphydryas editha]|uniref:Uncharacterized protein n=1 Tax=Euphydryas editha TaxID=104508 RepID=A0AAU9V1B2_EUPED|nr:unnamed protein product [Euphydryas editha]
MSLCTVRACRSLTFGGCRTLATLSILILISTTSPAPVSPYLATMVSVETTGLEIPTDFLAATDVGTGALQIVVNIRTDSQGNIEIISN